MSHFPIPHSEGTHDGFERRLIDDWEWEYELQGVQYRVFIPRGVVYEPSIPTIAEGAVPEDRLLEASLPHDVFYKLQGDLSRPEYPILASKWNGRWHRRLNVSKLYADRVFYKVMEERGVKWWRRTLAWWGIRSRWGQRAWDEEDDFQLPKRLFPDE
jgi:hypothetical protein